jgi:hypothetical protein
VTTLKVSVSRVSKGARGIPDAIENRLESAFYLLMSVAIVNTEAIAEPHQ